MGRVGGSGRGATRARRALTPRSSSAARATARYVKIVLPGPGHTLNLEEVQVHEASSEHPRRRRSCDGSATSSRRRATSTQPTRTFTGAAAIPTSSASSTATPPPVNAARALEKCGLDSGAFGDSDEKAVRLRRRRRRVAPDSPAQTHACSAKTLTTTVVPSSTSHKYRASRPRSGAVRRVAAPSGESATPRGPMAATTSKACIARSPVGPFDVLLGRSCGSWRRRRRAERRKTTRDPSSKRSRPDRAVDGVLDANVDRQPRRHSMCGPHDRRIAPSPSSWSGFTCSSQVSSRKVVRHVRSTASPR